MRAPILAGPLRGRWWLLESRGKVLRVLLGTYEREQTRRFAALVRAGDCVLDVGAHVGYYSLLAAALTGPAGTVVSFEPNPVNAGFLRRHAALNGLANLHVEEAAVCDRAGTALFAQGSGSGTGRLSENGALAVRTVRLDDVCAARGIAPRAVKIDVEGAESAVLRGFERTLAAVRPVLFLSTHGPATHAACVGQLRAAGYRLEPLLSGSVESSAELVCTPPAA